MNIRLLPIFAFILLAASCTRETTYKCTCNSVLTPGHGGTSFTYSESQMFTVTSKADAQTQCDDLKKAQIEKYAQIPDSVADVICDLGKE